MHPRQHQQPKTIPYGPELPQQQQHPQWENQGLLSLWGQPDVCCWPGSTDAQEEEESTTAAPCASAAFIDESIDDRLLLLSQPDVEVRGTGDLPQQQHAGTVEAGTDFVGAGDAAATDEEPRLSARGSPAAEGAPRPMPLQASECTRTLQMSEESPCSILFSGPKLFNVAADADPQD